MNTQNVIFKNTYFDNQIHYQMIANLDIKNYTIFNKKFIASHYLKQSIVQIILHFRNFSFLPIKL